MTKIALIRTGSLMKYREKVSELGGDPIPLLHEAGINPKLLENHDLFIPFDSLTLLLENTANRLQCEHFGLLLSKKQDVSMFGAIGLLLQQSDTVQGAIVSLLRFFRLHDQVSELDLIQQGERAAITFRLNRSGGNYRQFSELSMGICMNLARLLCGDNWLPKEVHTVYRAPPDPRALENTFNAPIRYNQRVNQILFNSTDLDQKISGSFSQFRAFLQEYLTDLEKKADNSRVSQAVGLIRSLLASEECNVDQIAELMMMGRRTFQRVLSSEGHTFRSLIKKVRKELVLQYLSNSDMTLSELGYVLGYSNISVFSRAFKKWFGVSPQAWQTSSKPSNE